jgi:hypothetical protein
VLLIFPFGLITIGVLVLVISLTLLFDREDWQWVDLILLLILGSLLFMPLNWIALIIFMLGLLLFLYQTRREWHWIDVVLLVWIPLLILPSALSIAFPIENPSLNRSAGAIIPVFLITALGLENLICNLKKLVPRKSAKWVSYSLIILIAFISMGTNYHLVFNTYYQEFSRRAWNSSEIGAVIRQFSDTVGDEGQAWVVAYPHWVDTRLVGIHAIGQVKEYGLWPSDLYITEEVPAPKLFIYNPEDVEAKVTLQQLYPDGIVEKITSSRAGKDFMLYYVLE